MKTVLDNTFIHSHMWPKTPLEWHDGMVDEVLEELGDTAVPRVDVVRGGHVDTAPGFREFLDKFVTRLINWYMNPDEDSGREMRDPRLPPPSKRKTGSKQSKRKGTGEQGTEEEVSKPLRKSQRLK